MAGMKVENVTIRNDPIMNNLQAIFDGKATNLQHFWLEMLVKVIVQEKCGHFKYTFDLLGI